MRYLVIFILAIAMLFPACSPSTPFVAQPVSPQNGSQTASLTPSLIWQSVSGAVTYRLLLSDDQNFQHLSIDANNLGEAHYDMPAGKLNSNTVYYWKIIVRKGDQMSNWSASWSFTTPGGSGPQSHGTVRVNALMDGSPWSGSVNYTLTGPFTDSDNSVPWNFENVPSGTYSMTYNFGGPTGTALTSITPSPSQALHDGGNITFSLNFHSNTTAAIKINATLNGTAWSGNVNYSLSGPLSDSEIAVPASLANLPSGAYTMTYTSGGPAGAMLNSITPSLSQTISPGNTITYTLNFITQAASSLSVSATLNGANWNGPLNYTISGPISTAGTQVPLSLNNAQAGNYNLRYDGGGPAGAILSSIVPASSIILSAGRSAGFVLNFSTQQTSGNIAINATINGSPWSGLLNYSINGPFHTMDNTVPRAYNTVPAGNYGLTYSGGGPDAASLISITPSAVQTLSGGRTIVFNLNFASQPSTGSITVNAALDGKPWQTALGSGTISYTVTGAKTSSSNTMPATFSAMPSGPYTLNYNSGGPPGATLTSISPSPMQNLSPGGTISYTLNFSGQPRGTITVNATLNGSPWSGEVGYVVQGPYVESGQHAPQNFSNAPTGTYSISYKAGGP
ncbi:MAG TPA: hypothetical protein VJ488_04930, partial [Dehalococcoidia bacterium]|nr:hypothetical protein [Dehalococcoidia bacterium]